MDAIEENKDKKKKDNVIKLNPKNRIHDEHTSR